MHLKNEKTRSRLSIVLASLILLIMFTTSLFASMGDSGTVDEIAHIPSGYSYLKYRDFRLNPEHPPLAKALSGIFLQFLPINDIRNNWSWEGMNQWEAGWNMLYRSGNSPEQILFWSRLPMVMLALALGVLIFIWCKKHWGRKVALFVLLLYAFYPDILGHSHLVTTDIAAAFGFVLTLYAFDLLIQKRTLKYLFIAGACFGIAQLLKFSSFLLFGILLILIIYRAKIEQKDKQSYWQSFWPLFKSYIWLCLISLAVVWLVYIPFVWNMNPQITHEVIEKNLNGSPGADFWKAALHHLENNVLTRAIGHYILGVVMVFARVAGGNATYILGEVSDKSIAWFFPVAWLIKTPITVILLFLWSLVNLAAFRSKHKEDSWSNWLLLTPIVVYWAFTLKGSLNIGIRHLIPTIPFVLLFIGKSMKRYLYGQKLTKQAVAIVLVVAFMVVEVVSYFPEYIAYFNVMVPREKRYKYMVDSSLDWGQDLLRLKKYVEENNIKSIKVDYFGGSVPPYYISESSEWHSSYGPTTGWLAVSATYFQSSKLYGPMEKKWSYHWLEDHKPEAIIGGSILVYNISNEDLASRPPVSPYPIEVIEEPGSIKVYK
ncbi:MAG: hypothetical protein BWY19_00973 [bacterium ADurb.Bin212]|nr:MAG: hypothetical protein BWY19_00973 [bacterium ADurb.Bin212]